MSELAAFVQRAAEQHPDLADPKALLPYVLADIKGREAEFLEKLLPRAISELLRRQKAVSSDPVESWESFLGERVSTDVGYHFARDCTADQLEAGAIRRRRFAGALDGRARQYAEAAVAVKTAGVLTAGELPLERGEVLMRELHVRLGIVRRQRLTLRSRATALRSASTRRDDLLRMVERKESPTTRYLRSHRDALRQLLADVLDQIERGQKTDRFLGRG